VKEAKKGAQANLIAGLVVGGLALSLLVGFAWRVKKKGNPCSNEASAVQREKHAAKRAESARQLSGLLAEQMTTPAAVAYPNSYMAEAVEANTYTAAMAAGYVPDNTAAYAPAPAEAGGTYAPAPSQADVVTSTTVPDNIYSPAGSYPAISTPSSSFYAPVSAPTTSTQSPAAPATSAYPTPVRPPSRTVTAVDTSTHVPQW
jgi:hypothetical protein